MKCEIRVFCLSQVKLVFDNHQSARPCRQFQRRDNVRISLTNWHTRNTWYAVYMYQLNYTLDFHFAKDWALVLTFYKFTEPFCVVTRALTQILSNFYNSNELRSIFSNERGFFVKIRKFGKWQKYVYEIASTLKRYLWFD